LSIVLPLFDLYYYIDLREYNFFINQSRSDLSWNCRSPVDMKKYKLKTPEQAIRRFKRKNANILFRRIERIDQLYEHCYA